ncbi:MAG: phosphoribosyl-AMP cyclohydrolase [Pseudomonadota bacterium]
MTTACCGDDDPIDETTAFRPRFGPDGLITVATTDVDTGALLMVAYMNREALEATLETGDAVYWSRSRQKLWRKGETSGHVQKVKEIRIDCDQDAIELVVEQTGAACHTGRRRCFYRVVARDENGSVNLVVDPKS